MQTAATSAPRRAESMPATGTIARIEYTQTRSVPVDRGFLRRQRLIAGLEPGPYVDAYKVLRTRVLQRMRENGWTTLGVTSPNAGAGKSLVAANLALSLALEVTQTVLLVDANLRQPSLHHYFGIDPAHGLGDHLLDGVAVERILVHPQGIDRFVLLPGNRSLPGSAELLSSPGTAKLVEELKHRYPDRLVIFDLPHWHTADALALAPRLDALLMVTGAGRTGQEALAQTLAQIPGIPIIGTVLNDAETAGD
ncbi:CpsD/CapB family tyrosine-protein kinase [Methylomagnum sp.]